MKNPSLYPEVSRVYFDIYINFSKLGRTKAFEVRITPVSDEKELLQRLRHGDSQAFRQIYDLYARRLSLKLLQLVKSEALAEDILQNIFIKVWEIRETIDPELSFGALLYKMAANLSKNAYRKNVYDQLMRNSLSGDEAYNPIEDAQNQAEAKAILDAALSKLTPRQREVYLMHKMEGHSYQEISERLKISASAINHHIQEATKQLKAALKNRHIYILMLLLPTFLKK